MRIEVPVPVRWSDMDAYGHVNNVDMLRLLEIARIEAFWASDSKDSESSILDAGPQAPTATLVARNEIEYLAPLEYRRDPVVVELWIGEIGGASLDISYVVRDGHEIADPLTYAIARTTLVLVDRATGKPRRVSAEEKASWQQFVEPAVRFKHRKP